MKAKRIMATNKGFVSVEEYEVGEIGKEDLLVETIYSAISPGTELAYLYQMENTSISFPYNLGYSACGTVLEIGANVEGFKIGDTIACMGKHASIQVIGSDRCISLPYKEALMDFSVYTIAAISMQGVRKAEIQIGDKVAVIGLGPIGNFAAQLAKVAGAGFVTGFDFIEWRRNIAANCGINEVEDSTEKDELQNKYDVVIEATGSPKAILSAFKIVKKFGRVILLGSSRGNTDNVNFYKDVHVKGITIIGSHSCYRAKEDNFGCIKTRFKDEEAVITLLNQKRIRSDLLINEVITADHAQDVYDRLYNKDTGLMLCVFDWTKK